MSDPPAGLKEAQIVKAKYESDLLTRPGVTGVGVGYRTRDGAYTDEVCIVVMVEDKLDPDQVPPGAMLPDQLEGIPVDVQEGRFSIGEI